MLALIAGRGDLPAMLHARLGPDVVVAEMEGFPSGLPEALTFRVEHLGTLFRDLKRRGVTEVCFAGAVRRPKLDPKKVDIRTLPLVPKVMAAMGRGDDGLLRTVIGLFEDQGFRVVGAHEVMPDILPSAGVLTRAEPDDAARKDTDRAAGILAALAAADVGQGCVVSRGQALAVETLGGTDWMLATLAGDGRPDHGAGGVLMKAPKPGQDRRVDLPTIGPRTVEGAASAGLSGIVVEAGGVILIDRDATVAAADAAGLFLWVRSP